MKIFNQISIKRPKSNAFNLSHEKKLTCNMGDLIPVYLEDAVPGDRFRLKQELMVKFAPLIAPIFHRVNATVHFFAIPYRLIYKEFPDFITGGATGEVVPPFPKIAVAESTKASMGIGSLADYLGVPNPPQGSVIVNDLEISALPFRAYQLVYNEYYRDQNLIAPVGVTTNSGVDATELAEILPLRKRCWERDYFCSSLPWAQRGGDVNLPTSVNYKLPATGNLNPDGTPVTPNTGAASWGTGGKLTDSIGSDIALENIDSLELTVNDLRKSVRLQEWLEKNARGGSRYIEQILSHFGVKSSDARLQRPEFLGGGRMPITISEVLSTFNTASDATEPVPGAQMYGHGIGTGANNGFTKFFEEHCLILGVLSILPRTNYMQGVDRMWTKFDKFDHYFPEFALLGEQEVKNKELFFDYLGATPANDGTFGYVPRFSEYKFRNSTVHGYFKDNLAFWHMARIFNSPPVLNGDFMKADPTTRCFAVTDYNDHHLYVQVYNNVQAIRPMPVFGTPTL